MNELLSVGIKSVPSVAKSDLGVAAISYFPMVSASLSTSCGPDCWMTKNRASSCRSSRSLRTLSTTASNGGLLHPSAVGLQLQFFNSIQNRRWGTIYHSVRHKPLIGEHGAS